MTPIPFEILKVGHCQQNERMACRAAAWRRSDFPALVALLRHPDAGVMLFDTGYAARFFAATIPTPAFATNIAEHGSDNGWSSSLRSLPSIA